MTLEVPPASSPAVHNVMIANKSTRAKPRNQGADDSGE